MEKRVKYSSKEVKHLIKETISRYSGLPNLEVWQENVVKIILSKNNSLLVMPPSVKKYICFIIPTIILDGTGLIFSPFKNTLNNQILLLKRMGVPYIFINKNKDLEDNYKNINAGFYKFLIFNDIKMLNKLKDFSNLTINSMILGFEYDNFYDDLLITKKNLVDILKIPMIILISNPSPEIRKDLIDNLHLKGLKVFVRGFDKPNLCCMVIKGEDKLEKVINVIMKVKGSGIIFVDSNKDADEIHSFLSKEGVSCELFINNSKSMDGVENKFYDGKINALITTKEYYKKINKIDLRFIIHYTIPLSLTEYYYETGIAGMDGKKSYCIILYTANDLFKCEEKIRGMYPEKDSEKRIRAFSELEVMEDYVFSKGCRKNYILSYFCDEEMYERCGICDVCVGYKKELALKKYDTNFIKIILKCIAELREKFGSNTIVDVLKGNQVRKVKLFNLENATTFGILKELDRKIIKENINNLISDGYISVSRGIYPTLELTHWGRNVIRDDEIFEINLPKFIDRRTDKPYDMVLFEELRIIRRKVAKRLNLPTFQIFPDKVLQEMATHIPENEEEMEKLKGVGKTKMELYGKKFIDAIKEYKRKKGVMGE